MFKLVLEKAEEPEIKLPTSTGSLKKQEFQIGKGVLWLFNLYAEYIMWHVRLDEAEAGIKIAGRNINNLRYADDTILMAKSKELQSLLIKVKKECEKVDLKLNIHKTKIMASGLIMANRWKVFHAPELE